MDPIHPIAPGPPAIVPGAPPVQRAERISRERDRPSREREERRRREPPPPPPPPERGEDDGEHPHIDVRA